MGNRDDYVKSCGQSEEYREDVVSEFVRKMAQATGGQHIRSDGLRNAQQLLEETFGMKGIERRIELHGLLVLCWYKLAHAHPDVGWYTNGDEFLEDLAKALTKCEKEVHVNHCCSLGLHYRKDRHKKDE